MGVSSTRVGDHRGSARTVQHTIFHAMYCTEASSILLKQREPSASVGHLIIVCGGYHQGKHAHGARVCREDMVFVVYSVRRPRAVPLPTKKNPRFLLKNQVRALMHATCKKSLTPPLVFLHFQADRPPAPLMVTTPHRSPFPFIFQSSTAA